MAEQNEAVETIPWEQFLKDTPPGRIYEVSGMIEFDYKNNPSVRTPDLELFCTHELCVGDRLFKCNDGIDLYPTQVKYEFLTYVCRNCGQRSKRYALFLIGGDKEKAGAAKLGEWPPFGPRVPSRVITLIGPDKELFLSGRRAENQGMGIGAFAYYRRVVDNQKTRLLEQIIKATERIEAPAENIKTLREAAKEKEFSKALDVMKSAIPDVIKIRGHNPLRLLYKALSDGLHAKSDTECLNFAQTIRVVLTELADKLGQVLKDQAEIDTALKQLFKDGKSADTKQEKSTEKN